MCRFASVATPLCVMIWTSDRLSFFRINHLHRPYLLSALLYSKVAAILYVTVQLTKKKVAILCTDAIHFGIIEIEWS